MKKPPFGVLELDGQGFITSYSPLGQEPTKATQKAFVGKNIFKILRCEQLREFDYQAFIVDDEVSRTFEFAEVKITFLRTNGKESVAICKPSTTYRVAYTSTMRQAVAQAKEAELKFSIVNGELVITE